METNVKVLSEKRKESCQERSDRVAREIMLSERQARVRKTARLRALRVEMEALAN